MVDKNKKVNYNTPTDKEWLEYQKMDRNRHKMAESLARVIIFAGLILLIYIVIVFNLPH